MSSTRPRILYIGGGREIVDTLRKASSLELDIVYIQRKEAFTDRVLPYVDEVCLVDFRDSETLLALARTLWPIYRFGAVISLSEDALEPTAQVVDALGLPGCSLRTVQLLRDKWAMRQRLRQFGLSPVGARLGSTCADITTFADEYGYPVVIKPTNDAGSFGVRCIDDATQVEAAVRRLCELGIVSFLIEEFLDGPEISVETFSFDGCHVTLAITEKLTEGPLEIGHSTPARLDQATARAATDLVEALLDAVGLRDGPAHTEVKLTRAGPRIVESHNRPGGDRISELVRLATGVDIKQLCFAWPLGLHERLGGPPPPVAGSAIRFLTPPLGTVTSVSGLDEVRRLPGFVDLDVSAAVGDKIGPIEDSHARCGHVLACAPTADEAIRRCDEMRDLIRITLTPDERQAARDARPAAHVA